MEMQHDFTADAAAPAPHNAAPALGPDPREADRLVCEMVLALGRDAAFAVAGRWSRIFVQHAAVVTLAFAAVAALQGWG